MKRLFLLSIVLTINLIISPLVFAQEVIIVDKITNQQAEELNIEIPAEVPPGFHTVKIEVLDKTGAVSEKNIEFCKDTTGVVDWENNCPNLDYKDPAESTEKIVSAYNPMSDKEATKGLHIAAFAILYALTSLNREGNRFKKVSQEKKKETEQENIQSVAAGKMKVLQVEPGRGDLARDWSRPLTIFTDNLFAQLADLFNSRFPLISRTIIDGNSIRAIFGGPAIFLPIIGIALGAIASISVEFQALPPSWILVSAIVIIATLDAFAGLAAGTTFFILALITGNINSRPEFLTALGLLILFFIPVLLASTFRPFRRLVNDRDEDWERLTDYLIATLLSFWVIAKMVGALAGLARLELPITSYAELIALIGGFFVGVRLFIEDYVSQHYPRRLEQLHLKINDQSGLFLFQSILWKGLFFVFLAAPFAGSMLNLFLGTLIFLIPLLTAITLESRLPKIRLPFPSGTLKIVVMIFIMALVSNWIESRFSSTESYLKWNFVLMALPGFVFHYVKAFSKPSNQSWRTTRGGRLIYRLGGIATFIIMAAVVEGTDITAWLFN